MRIFIHTVLKDNLFSIYKLSPHTYEHTMPPTSEVSKPIITAINFSNAQVTVGGSLQVTLTVADDGGDERVYLSAMAMFEHTLYDLTRINSTTYSFDLPVPEGIEITDEDFWIPLVVFNSAGISSAVPFEGVDFSGSVSIDTARPDIEQVTIAGTPKNVGDTLAVTLTVEDDKGDTYTNLVGTVSGFELSNLVRVDSTTYTAEFTVGEGGIDTSASGHIPVSLTLDDSVGNTSHQYSNPTLIESPTVLAVSSPDTAFKIGDMFTFFISVADDNGEIYTKATIGNPEGRQYDLVRVNSTTYTLSLPIPERYEVNGKKTYFAAEEDLRLRITVFDAEGNMSNSFLTNISNDNDSIDLARPIIEQVSIADTAMQAGDTVTVTLTVEDDKGDAYTNLVGTIGGFELNNLVRVDSTTYTAEFTVRDIVEEFAEYGAGPWSEYHAYLAAEENVGVSLVIEDSAGNVSDEFTTAISQSNDPIDSRIGPNILAVSEVNGSFKIGDILELTITVVDDGGDVYSKGISPISLRLHDLTRINSTTYTMQIPIDEQFDLDENVNIDSSMQFFIYDSSNNISNFFSVPLSEGSSIDFVRPVIEQVSIADTAMQIGDTVAVTLTVQDDDGDNYTNLVGSVGGFDLSNLVRVDSTTYTAEFTVGEGGTDVAVGEDIPVSLILDDSAGNTSNEFTTAISQSNDAIDANGPVITAVSSPDTAFQIGDIFTFTINVADDNGETYTKGTIGNPEGRQYDLTRVDSTTYTLSLPIPERYEVSGKKTFFAAEDDLRIRITVFDAAGNKSNGFLTDISNDNDSIDLARPIIEQVSIADTAMQVGDTVAVTLTVEDDSGHIYTNLAGSIGGFDVSNLVRVDSTTYTAEFTVGEGGTDVAADADIPVSLIIEDPAGNASNEFTTAISQQNDPVDSTSPVISSVSIPDTALIVGETATVTLTVEDDNGDIYTNLVGTVGGFELSNLIRVDNTTYTADFTVQEGGTDVSINEDIPVSLTLEDAAGNTSNEFAGPVSQSNTRVIFDLINGTSTDIDGRAFSSDKAYDIYILVDSESETLVGPSQLWSDKTNLDADDTIYLVGNGAPILNGAGNAVVSGRFDSGTVYWSSVANLVGAILNTSGKFVREYYPSNTNAVDLFTSDTLWASFQVGDIYSTPPNIIDANTPTIASVSIPDQAMAIDDIVSVTISASESGLSLVSGSVNGIAVTDFTDNGGGSYSAVYTVAEGHTNIAAGEYIPVSFVLADSAGNDSAAFTTAIIQTSDPIDVSAPVIGNVSISQDVIKVGDVVTLTLAVWDDGGDTYTNLSGTVGGFALSNLSRIDSTTYTAEFTVAEGGADVRVDTSIYPDSLTLEDSRGNISNEYLSPVYQPSTNVVFDLITGFSSDIRGRAFLADETYDIYILVDSNSKTLEQPVLWSDAANLGSDDTIHLVGDGSPIINVSGNAINQVMTTTSGAIVWYSLGSSEIAGSTAAFTPGATLASGYFNRGHSASTGGSSSSVQLFTTTNNGDGFSLGNIYNSIPNIIDANSPTILNVSTMGSGLGVIDLSGDLTGISLGSEITSIPSSTGVTLDPVNVVTVGQSLMISIEASESGLSLTSGTVNGIAVTDFYDLGDGFYTAIYTVAEGHTDRAADEAIPVAFVLQDYAGNTSDEFTTTITLSGDAIDANGPTISEVSIPNVPMKVGDEVLVTINANEAGLSPTYLNVNGALLTDFTDLGDGTYTAIYTVLQGYTDIAADVDIPVWITLEDSAGNRSEEFTAISQNNDPIDSNAPEVLDVSISQDVMKVGDVVTVTLTLWDDLSDDIYTNLSGTVGGFALSNLSRIDSTTYTAEFTVTEDGADVAAGEDIPVSLTLDDPAGNTSAVFTAPATQSSTKVVFDLINGTSSDIDSRVFSADETYDIYILVDSDSAALSQPDLWSDAANLGSDDTLHLVGDGSPIINASGNPIKDVTFSGAQVFWFSLGSSETIGSALYTPGASALSGVFVRAYGSNSTSSSVQLFTSNNLGYGFSLGDIYSTVPNVIDANSPVITEVTMNPRFAGYRWKVGDEVTVTLTVDDDGGDIFTNLSGTVGGFDVSNLSRIDSTTYTAEFTVIEGGADVAEGDDIPVSLTLDDSAGNTSTAFTTPATQSITRVVFDLINGTSTDIDGRAFSSDELYYIYIVVDSMSTTLKQPELWTDAENLADNAIIHLVGNGFPVETSRPFISDGVGHVLDQVNFYTNAISWIHDLDGPSSGTYLTGAKLSMGNFSRGPFTSLSVMPNAVGLFTHQELNYADLVMANIPSLFNLIDANSPVITEVSLSQDVMKVDDVVIVTLTVEDDGGNAFRNISGTVGGFDLSNLSRINSTTYTAEFTVIESGADVAAGDEISVAVRLSDYGGNTSALFTTPATQSSINVVFDLINGTSSDIDGRAFSIDKTYDIYILVGSDFAGLEQPDIWSGKTNLGSDDTIYLVGNGPGIISSNGNPVTDIEVNASLGAISWHGHTSGWIPGYTRTYFTTIPDPGAFLNPTGLFQRSANSSSDQVRLFTSTTLLASYEAGDIYNTPPNIIDANTPTIASVSIPDQAMDIDDVVSVTISASESGLSLVSGSVNGIAVTDFTDNGGGSYSAIYTVAEGHTDIAAGDDIPVSFVMSDDAGNQSAEFTSAISQTNDSINGSTISAPVITGLSIPNAPIKIGDVVTLTITVEDDGGDIYPTDVVGPITRINSTTYTSEFTIPDGSVDFAAGEDIPFETQIFDSAGNASNVFKVSISQDNDPIDANAPVITNASMSGNATKVGDTVTVTITVEDDGGDIYTGLVGNVGGFALGDASRIDNTTYTADFTVQEGGADVALNSDILISLTLEDTAGNTSNEFSGPVIQKNINTRVIFDLINGTSTDLDGRVITANKTYDIYILVDSNSNSVTLDSSETWSGKENLGADDTIYLVGNGSPILNRADDFIITTPGTSHFINWYSTPNNLNPGAHLTSAGLFQRSYNSFNSNVELFSTTNSWDGLQFGDIYSTLPNIIDANSPVITSVSIPDTTMTVDDTVTVTIFASESGLRLVNGSVNGVSVTDFTDNGGGSYSANYTVAVGDTERAAGDDIPVSFVLEDSAGNSSTAFTTAISQGSDAIDINPDASNVRVVFDLINGTSTDIDSRTFASDKTYDIYIQVDSNSKTLSQPEIWSGGSNLGSDDTIYLVGNGSNIIGYGGHIITQGYWSSSTINWSDGAYLWTSHFRRSYSYSNSEVNLFASTLSTLINIGPVFTTLPGTGPTFTSTSPSIFVSAG